MPSPVERRATDALRAVDGLLQVHLKGTAVKARPLANLAVAMAIDFSGAAWGALLLDEGDGLEQALLLGERPAGAEIDSELVARASAAGETTPGDGRLAAPVVEGNRLRGLLYLDGLEDARSREAVDLATAVATRIGTLLRSAELVEELSRRTRDMGLLEALGACLAAGSLTGERLEEALAGAVEATRSREGLLGLLTSDGELLELHLRGEDERGLRRLGRDLAHGLAGGRGEAPGVALGEPHLFAPLRPELVRADLAQTTTTPVGFVMVRGAPEPYRQADRSFFGAVVHLLDGALARVDYFRRAAEDPLTATGSRLALKLKLCEAQSLSLKTGKPFSVILADLDRFKEINDLYGHLVGDQVLQEVAQVLRSRLRADDSVARYGGDEFVVILPLTGAHETARLADELRELVAARRFSRHELKLSVSMGVASFASEGCQPEDVLRRADEALYGSKTAGRDTVTVAGDVPA